MPISLSFISGMSFSVTWAFTLIFLSVSRQVADLRGVCECADDNDAILNEMQVLAEKLRMLSTEEISGETRLEAVREMHDVTLTDARSRCARRSTLEKGSHSKTIFA